MSAETRMQPEVFERLKSALENISWDRDSIAEYVTELDQRRHEEDIFHRLVLRDGNFGGASSAPCSVSAFSEMYDAMSVEKKAQLRRWWHEKLRRRAYYYDDLRARISWRYLV